MASVDSLSILITASTTTAKGKIDALTKSLWQLSMAIDSLDVSKFQSLADFTGELSQSLSGLKGVGVKEIKALSKSLNDISTQKDPFKPIAQGAEEVAKEAQKVTENTDQVSEGLGRIIQSLNILNGHTHCKGRKKN